MMEINRETVEAHFILMTKPKEHGLPIRPLEECFTASEEVTAQHILFESYQRENPRCAKVFFYIVMQRIFGQPVFKDKNNNLGFKLKFVESERTFFEWLIKLKTLVGNMDQRYHAYFDFKTENLASWAKSFESGLSPEDCLRENLEALTN